LEWLNDNEEDLIIGHRNQVVKTFSLDSKSFTRTLDAKSGDGPLRGIGAVDETVITGNGTYQNMMLLLAIAT